MTVILLEWVLGHDSEVGKKRVAIWGFEKKTVDWGF